MNHILRSHFHDIPLNEREPQTGICLYCQRVPINLCIVTLSAGVEARIPLSDHSALADDRPQKRWDDKTVRCYWISCLGENCAFRGCITRYSPGCRLDLLLRPGEAQLGSNWPGLTDWNRYQSSINYCSPSDRADKIIPRLSVRPTRTCGPVPWFLYYLKQ